MVRENALLVLHDFNFALNVMQDRSHLGLDSAFASRLQSVMLKRIARAEEALKTRPSIVAQSQQTVDVAK